MGKKITVYNIETGKPATVPGVDAMEYVKNGGWSRTPVEIKEIKPNVILPEGFILLNDSECKDYVKEIFERDISKVTVGDLRIYCAENFDIDVPAGVKKSEIISFIKTRNEEK